MPGEFERAAPNCTVLVRTTDPDEICGHVRMHAAEIVRMHAAEYGRLHAAEKNETETDERWVRERLREV